MAKAVVEEILSKDLCNQTVSLADKKLISIKS